MLLYPETKATTALEILKQQTTASKNHQNSNGHLKFSIASLLNNNLQNGKSADCFLNNSSYDNSNDNCFNYDSSIKNWINWLNYQRQTEASKYDIILNRNKNRTNIQNHQNNTFQINQQPIMNTSIPHLNTKQKTNQNQNFANQFNYTSTLSNSAGGKIPSSISNKKKRARTIFSNEQLEVLEIEFERSQYMVGLERVNLASRLNLSEAQVKVWFQNRRIKFRKCDFDKRNNV